MDLPHPTRLLLGLDKVIETEIAPDVFVQERSRGSSVTANVESLRRVRYSNMIISTHSPNNVVRLEDDEIVIIKKIVLQRDTNTVNIHCEGSTVQSAFDKITEKCIGSDAELYRLTIDSFKEHADSIASLVQWTQRRGVITSITNVKCLVACVPVNSEHVLCIQMCHRFIHE